MNHYLDPVDYLPHDAPMLLLEEVVSVTATRAHCRVTVSQRGVLSPFLDSGGNLPGWYALELMAQTVGVWSGWRRRQKDQKSMTLGMVLGARELVCAGCHLPGGKTLDIEINLLMQDRRFGSFDGVIQAGEARLASGRVNVFQPTSEELTALFTQGDIA